MPTPAPWAHASHCGPTRSAPAFEKRHPLPDGVKGRARERWSPLKRVAAPAGGRWPDVVDQLAVRDVERVGLEREEGFVQQRPGILLLCTSTTCGVWWKERSSCRQRP